MKAKRVKITIESIRDYVLLMNSFFHLTDKEVDVLCEFIKEKIRRSQMEKDPNTHLFHHSVKRKISRDAFGKSHHHWINGYVMNLKEKNALIPLEEDSHYKINKGLIPSGENKIVISIDWNTNEEKKQTNEQKGTNR